MSNVPRSTPRQTRDQSVAQRLLPGHHGRGRCQRNRGIHDDAIMLITPSASVSFNANADPSAFRKGIANPCPGVYQYRLGIDGLNKPVDKRATLSRDLRSGKAHLRRSSVWQSPS